MNNYEKGSKDTRPWGKWEVIEVGPNYCIKKIEVNPKGKLSLQSHNYRAEHWIIVSGKATITLGENILEKDKDEAIYIPIKTKHRIENKYDAPLVFIEVQTGDTLDEDDIIRYEDIYGRNK